MKPNLSPAETARLDQIRARAIAGTATAVDKQWCIDIARRGAVPLPSTTIKGIVKNGYDATGLVTI